jgi:hypothetical protein
MAHHHRKLGFTLWEATMRALQFGMIVLVAGLSAPASGAEIIGQSVAVIPAAFSELDGQKDVLDIGKDVLRDAFIATDKGGSTTLRFSDASELKIGERARVKLDRFVYEGATTFSNARITMMKGSFRWATGQSPKSAYKLSTPTALIGIRGTVLEIDVSQSATMITVIEGAITACTTDQRRCLDADPKTGTIRITKDDATIASKDQAPEIHVKPKPKQPAIAPKRRAEVAPDRPAQKAVAPAKRTKQAEASPKKKRRITRSRGDIIIDDGEIIHLRQRPRKVAVDPGLALEFGFGFGNRIKKHRPQSEWLSYDQ